MFFGLLWVKYQYVGVYDRIFSLNESALHGIMRLFGKDWNKGGEIDR